MSTSHFPKITQALLDGGFLRMVPSPTGRERFRLYDRKANSLMVIKPGVIKRFNVEAPEKDPDKIPTRILRLQKNGQLTIIRSAVRKLHGNSLIKQAYLLHLKTTKHNG